MFNSNYSYRATTHSTQNNQQRTNQRPTNQQRHSQHRLSPYAPLIVSEAHKNQALVTVGYNGIGVELNDVIITKKVNDAGSWRDGLQGDTCPINYACDDGDC